MYVYNVYFVGLMDVLYIMGLNTNIRMYVRTYVCYTHEVYTYSYIIVCVYMRNVYFVGLMDVL